MGSFVSGFLCRSVENPQLLDAIPPSFGFRLRRSESLNLDAIELFGYGRQLTVADPFVKYQVHEEGDDRFYRETKKLSEVCGLLDTQFAAGAKAPLVGAWFLSKVFRTTVVGYACDDDLIGESFSCHDGVLKRAWVRFDDVAADLEYVEGHTRVRFNRIEDEDEFFVELKGRQSQAQRSLTDVPNVETFIAAETERELHAPVLQALEAENLPVPMGIGTWDFDTEDESFVVIAERSITPKPDKRCDPLPPFAFPVKFLAPGWFARRMLSLEGEGRILFLETEPRRTVLRVLADQKSQKCRDYLAEHGNQVSHSERGRLGSVMVHELTLDEPGKHHVAWDSSSITLALHGGLRVKVKPQGLLRNRLIEYVISGGKTFAPTT